MLVMWVLPRAVAVYVMVDRLGAGWRWVEAVVAAGSPAAPREAALVWAFEMVTVMVSVGSQKPTACSQLLTQQA